MIEIQNKENCCGCGACVSICPKECIKMQEDSEGFLYPIVDKDKCIKCNICEKVCPFLSVNKTKVYKTYGFNSRNEIGRMLSSSGGFFSILAENVISCGGIVFGVGLTKDCKASCYYTAEDFDELECLKGSKYLQVNTEHVFKKVKMNLEKGRKVLFSGTPCIINGLKMFLRCSYENLICMDVICHGVPSKKLWIKHLKYIEDKNNIKIISINFRYKYEAWKNFCIGYNTYQNLGNIVIPKNEDPYMVMFLDNYSLRPSCFSCKVKGNNMADITAGDFWGIENICPELNDGKGSSLIILRTEKGQEIFESLKEAGRYVEVCYKDAVKYNIPEFKSVEKPKKREKFYKDLDKKSYERIIHKYCGEPVLIKIKNKIKKSVFWKIYKNSKGGGI